MARPDNVRLAVEISSIGVVRPGDRLILGFSSQIDMAQADRIAVDIAARLPGVDVTVIDQLTAMAVYRPETETT